MMAPHHPQHPQHVQAAVHHHHGGPMPHPGSVPMGPMIAGPPQAMGPMPGQMPAPPPGPMPYPNFHLHGPQGYLMDDELQLEEKPKWDFCGENYINVDRFFLVAMPCLFLVFNVVYWFAYGSNFILSSSDDEVKITQID